MCSQSAQSAVETNIKRGLYSKKDIPEFLHTMLDENPNPRFGGRKRRVNNRLAQECQVKPEIMQSIIQVKCSTRFIGRVPAGTRPGESTLKVKTRKNRRS